MLTTINLRLHFGYFPLQYVNHQHVLLYNCCGLKWAFHVPIQGLDGFVHLTQYFRTMEHGSLQPTRRRPFGLDTGQGNGGSCLFSSFLLLLVFFPDAPPTQKGSFAFALCSRLVCLEEGTSIFGPVTFVKAPHVFGRVTTGVFFLCPLSYFFFPPLSLIFPFTSCGYDDVWQAGLHEDEMIGRRFCSFLTSCC